MNGGGEGGIRGADLRPDKPLADQALNDRAADGVYRATLPATRQPIDLARLRADIHYDPETGRFIRKRFMRGIRGGRPAGSVCDLPAKYGYRKVIYRQVSHAAHRLAWYYVHGAWPPQMVDHANGDRSDNRLVNLRLADPYQNAAHAAARRVRKSLVPGVRWIASAGRWHVYLTHRHKRHYLGSFVCVRQAVAARRSAEARFFGEFAPPSPLSGREG